jgi:hypothetical protein
MTKWVHTCDAYGPSLYQRSQKGRFRSGQTGQTVNLLALRLRWFESSPAHFFVWHGHPGCGAKPESFRVECSNRFEFANRAED